MDEPLSNLDAKLRVQMRTEVSRLQDRLGTTMVYVTHDQTEAMTLGDRVAIMRAGILQQVGTPMELYNSPANLFVAGFIGSPAMNFMPGRVSDGGVNLPLGEVRIPPERRERMGRIDPSKTLIVGIRPEDFEDATLVGEARERGGTFRTKIDVLEAMGSEFYAHFTVQMDPNELGQSEDIRDLQADVGEAGASSGTDFVARLDQTSRLREHEEGELWINSEKMQFFDPETGQNLTAR
jgi:multiple sugar transport system ATP-binding protein